MSKSLFQSSKRNCWRSIAVIRKKNYNTVPVIDNTRGDVAIAELFKDKYATLYNSVSSSSNSMKALHERIRGKIASQCDTCVNPSLHTHSVSITDVIKAVNHLKSDKYNDDGILMSNNFLHGTHLLYTCIAQLFSAMVCYGFAPRLFLRSTMIPIPKGGRSSSSNSDHFRSIAISSILSKILDYIIIDQQAHSLITSDHQFGFKPNSPTVLCTTMLVETVQYYDENGRQPVYVLQLDASKAFDRVSYSRLFNVLLDKNVCPYIARLLCYMYLNQNCCVKWNSKNSTDFSVSNGVKQGAVISPILFSSYRDALFDRLKRNAIGCHVGPVYAGAFGYADDVALVAPSLYSLRCMIATCEEFANEYQIDFNPTKSKLICFNANIDHTPHIILNGQPVSVVLKDKHLGNYISSSINDRHIIENTCDLYQRSNLLISQFRPCNSETLDRLHMTYCMHMYGCELWNLNEKDVNQFKVAWRKIKRRIWKIPPRTHNNLVCNITNNIDAMIDKRMVRFIYNSISHSNKTISNLLRVKLLCVNSTFSANYQYLSFKYGLTEADWYINIDHLMGKVRKKMSILVSKVYFM